MAVRLEVSLMLSPFEEKILDEILGWEDADAAIMYLIKNFAKADMTNARMLLGTIPGIVDAAIGKVTEFAARHSQASYWLMCQREMEPDKSGMFFASMLPVCMARFPSGNSEGCCKAEKDYFDLFLTMFRDKKQFSWEKDKGWADMHGYTDYLLLVESQLKGEKK